MTRGNGAKAKAPSSGNGTLPSKPREGSEGSGAAAVPDFKSIVVV
ncbi:hypothetical protein [Paenibacillus sp. Soil522]|nr:hypothetical protein [Paenibacillus sp. Soil522]